MPDIAAKVIGPDDVDRGETGPFPFEQFAKALLAQGDSWFSVGHLPPGTTTNLLLDIELPWPTAIVNCGVPGELLSRMADTTTKPKFLRLLKGRLARRWDAILLSGGGNDLIEAVQSPPIAEPARRLLATAAEWGEPRLDRTHYLSEAGWATFENHLRAVFALFMAARHGGVNTATPVFLHDYDLATPRASGAGPGNGPWLQPAMLAFAIPEDDWAALARALLERLSRLLADLAAGHEDVFLVHTLGTLVPARTDDEGETEHWKNEIHPTRAGYRRLDRVWRDALHTVLG